MHRFSLAALIAFLLPPLCAAQEVPSSTASSIYRAASPSVFLVEVRNTAGEVVASGTAFLVENGVLATNEHVLRGGTPYLKTGAVALPLTVRAVDAKNDLALLVTSVPLEARPIPRAPRPVSAGSRVWAIGNPQGLERTISEGLASGERDWDGRTLLQIGAAISPGSSGGPVLEENGQLVGVVVSYLRGGQNLNFAVPVRFLEALLLGGADATAFTGVAERIRAIAAEQVDYRDQPAVRRQRVALEAALDEGRARARSGEDFLVLATVADKEVMPERTIEYGREALRRRVGAEDSARELVIEGLYWRAMFSETKRTRQEMLTDLAFTDSLLARRPTAWSARAFRAEILAELPERRSEALGEMRRAFANANRSPWAATRYHDLAAETSFAADSLAWLEITASGAANQYQWTNHAAHLYEGKRYAQAGAAYYKAYTDFDEGKPEYLCRAGQAYWGGDMEEAALKAFRDCVEQSATVAQPSKQWLSYAHRALANILVDRGVHAVAESHARQALQLDPKDGWAAISLARALQQQGRFSEAAAAAEEAIRITDGANESAHFAAGSAYFSLADWRRCADSYKRAYAIEAGELAAAYNAGLCMARQGYYSDAARWWEALLAKAPQYPKRAEMLKSIAEWRR